MVEINNFSFAYKSGRRETRVFNDLSFSFKKGHIYGLLGSNGAGKSTLLYAIAGLLKPTSGIIEYQGHSTFERRTSFYSDLFLVPEEFVLPNLTLEKYIKLYAPFYPHFNKEDLYRYLEIFELMDINKLNELSMGQKKKVMMCFGLACNTPLIIMDEPTNGLDIPSKAQFRKLISSGMTDDKTIIISTHQVADVENLLDYVTIINEGKILLDATVNDICDSLYFGENQPNAIYSQPYVGGNYTVSANTSGEESKINLELLFNATITNPEAIKQTLV